MSDFKKQYDKELKYQEEKSNKYTLNGVVMLIAVELIVWALNTIGIFEIDRRTITVAVIISIILLIPIVFMIMKEDVSKECYKYIGLMLICTATGVMCALLSYHAVLLYVIPLLFAAHYRQKKILWFTSLINSVSVFLSMTLGFYYGICDLNILFEGSHKRDWYINVLESGTG